MKTCIKCCEGKAASAFSRKASAKDGLQSVCKTCKKIQSAEYRIKNLEKLVAAYAKWRAENPEKAKAAKDAWRAKNVEHEKQYRVAYRKANSETGD